MASPDGRTLLFVQNGDLFAAPLRGGAASTAFLRSPGNSQAPRFSPDGRWVAFHSTLSGRRVTSRAVLLGGDFASDPTHAQYDVAPDGRFVMLRGGEPSRLAVVLNWRPTEDTR
jgi:Tol biopolymer transport system component